MSLWRYRRWIRLVGNWGTGFFGTLLGLEVILEITFIKTLMAALFIGFIQLGLTVSRELAEYGSKSRGSRST